MVCASVDPSSYVVVEHRDGSVEAQPINPDLVDWTSRRFDEALADRIGAVAREEQVQVMFRELAGDIAHALGRLGDLLEAEMIVVGSRWGGVRATVHDFLGGSVAAHLAHRQHRPVVVIPLSPRSIRGTAALGRGRLLASIRGWVVGVAAGPDVEVPSVVGESGVSRS
jgi:nucleotide-binding universal stress UspA family protein